MSQPELHAHPLPETPPGSFFGDLLKVYVPRSECMYFEGDLIWLHAVSDLLIALAYYSIPVALFVLLKKRRDLVFPWVFWLFAAFIFVCGTTHLLGLLALWHPVYRLDGLVKAMTASISVVTAILLWPAIPAFLRIPSPSMLSKLNEDLQQEIEVRCRAEAELLAMKDALELNVAERTGELKRANEHLEQEIEARREAEVERTLLLESERAARAQAERLNRLKDEFVASVSHELRTPLHAIKGWLHLLKARLDSDDERQQRAVTIIERNLEAQNRLVGDLLDLSRIVSGKMRLQVGEIDPVEMLESTVESLRPALEAKTLIVELDVEDLPQFLGDADRLRQILWNLLSNAVKFTPSGGKITVGARSSASDVTFSVRDSGPGVPAEFLPHLFERFRQADASTSRTQGGLGIGLGIVKSLVELHGGSVSARNADSGGALFEVVLPRRPHLAPTEYGDVGATGSRDRLAELDVLVVEDDPDSLEMLLRILEERGARARGVASASEARAACDERRPALLVSDIGLPGEDGIALLRSLRERFGDAMPPAVAVTAYDRKLDRDRAREAGFDAYLGKPIDPLRLLATIDELVRAAEAPRDGGATDDSVSWSRSSRDGE